jgi:hypothetical protein
MPETDNNYFETIDISEKDRSMHATSAHAKLDTCKGTSKIIKLYKLCGRESHQSALYH